MPFSWFVALRYLREGRMQTLLILAGVAVGVGVIIFLTALIDGLQTTLIDRTLGYQAHIVVRPPEEAPRPLAVGDGAALDLRIEKPAQRIRPINQWSQIVDLISQTRGVTATSAAASGAAFASRGNASRSIFLRGVDPDRFNRIIDVRRNVRSGTFETGGGKATIGVELAKDLGIRVGDKMRIATPEGRGDVFTVSGIFDLQNLDVNQRWVLIALPSAQTILDLAGGVSTIEVKVSNVFDAEEIAEAIRAKTGLIAESWMEVNQQLLVGLKSQNSSRYMIELFVVIAVALGIASVLVVWVVQKNREIGILRAVGTSRAQILKIFLIQGAVLGFLGAIGGMVVGTGLSHFFQTLARNPDGSPTFPVALNLPLYLAGAALATLTGLFASIAPARRAAALDPADAIHQG
jgi:lipoprotein-releasing system permease protein